MMASYATYKATLLVISSQSKNQIGTLESLRQYKISAWGRETIVQVWSKSSVRIEGCSLSPVGDCDSSVCSKWVEGVAQGTNLQLQSL